MGSSRTFKECSTKYDYVRMTVKLLGCLMSKILIILMILISISLNATNSLSKLKLGCDLGNEEACKEFMSLDSEQNKKSELTSQMFNSNILKIDNENKIIVTGHGVSREQALNNAFKTAIEQYIGVVVDSDTMLKNGKLLKDDILTASNGFIQTYREIMVNEENGLFEVSIEAVVKSQKLFKKIKSLNIATLTVYNSEDSVARIKHEPVKNVFSLNHYDPVNVSTMNNSKKNVENIMRKLFDDFFSAKSIKDMIEIEVTNMKIYEENYNGESVPVKVYYTLSINDQIYNQKIEYIETVFKNLRGEYHSKVDSPRYKKYHGDTLWMNSSKSENIKVSSVGIVKKYNKGYVLDIWEFPPIWKDIYPFNIASPIKLAKIFRMNLQFKDKNNKVILSVGIKPKSSKKQHLPVSSILLTSIMYGGMSYGYIPFHLKEENVKIIAPMFSIIGLDLLESVDCSTELNINIDDVKKIKYVTIEEEDR